MNTADRSIALMDIALRRRFEFAELLPDPELLDGLKVDVDGKEVDVRRILETLNLRIEGLFDLDHTLGHAFFMPLRKNPSREMLESIFRNSVIPLLQEYFYDDWDKIRIVLGDHPRQGAFKAE